MTSSFTIKKLNEQRDTWTFASKGSTLGGSEDRHIRISGNCHPDFVSVPIGNAHGAQLCVRRADQCGSQIGDTLMKEGEAAIENSQGYHRGSVNLYDVHQRLPTQQVNPAYYSDRRMPYDADLLRRDLIRTPLAYSGTGIKSLRTPAELSDTGHPYLEYALAFTPQEDPATGMRTATSWRQNVPVPKYDITQLHQRYNVQKNEASHMGHPLDHLDTKHFERIV